MQLYVTLQISCYCPSERDGASERESARRLRSAHTLSTAQATAPIVVELSSAFSAFPMLQRCCLPWAPVLQQPRGVGHRTQLHLITALLLGIALSSSWPGGMPRVAANTQQHPVIQPRHPLQVHMDFLMAGFRTPKHAGESAGE